MGVEGFHALGPGLARHGVLWEGGPLARRVRHRTRGASLPSDPEHVAASVAIAAALLQGILARWRDLGPLTLTACGAAMLLSLPRPSPVVPALVGLAVLLASAGWARGAARGVGRPALDGLVIAGGFAAAVAVTVLPPLLPASLPPAMLEAAAVGALVLLGTLAQGLALERPGGARAAARWVGEIPVRGAPPTLPRPTPATGPDTPSG